MGTTHGEVWFRFISLTFTLPAYDQLHLYSQNCSYMYVSMWITVWQFVLRLHECHTRKPSPFPQLQLFNILNHCMVAYVHQLASFACWLCLGVVCEWLSVASTASPRRGLSIVSPHHMYSAHHSNHSMSVLKCFRVTQCWYRVEVSWHDGCVRCDCKLPWATIEYIMYKIKTQYSFNYALNNT